MDLLIMLLSTVSATFISSEWLSPEKLKDKMRYWPGMTLPALTSLLTERPLQENGWSQNRKKKKVMLLFCTWKSLS